MLEVSRFVRGGDVKTSRCNAVQDYPINSTRLFRKQRDLHISMMLELSSCMIGSTKASRIIEPTSKNRNNRKTRHEESRQGEKESVGGVPE